MTVATLTFCPSRLSRLRSATARPSGCWNGMRVASASVRLTRTLLLPRLPCDYAGEAADWTAARKDEEAFDDDRDAARTRNVLLDAARNHGRSRCEEVLLG